MKKESRKEKVLRNVSSQMKASLVQCVIGFVSRKIFLDCLGDNLLGLNGLLTSIIGMLSLVELGVGEAINFSLYEPLAKNDKEQVTAIMRLNRKLFFVIGIATVVLGIILVPFLGFFTGTAISMQIVYKAYALFLLNTFLSYCLAYHRNIISADQRDYIITNVDTIAKIVLNVLQLTLLVLTKNYYLYLYIQIAVTVVRNIYIYFRAKKMYPYLNCNNGYTLSKDYIRKLSDNVRALFATRIAYFCVSGTDNLLLSSFVSLGAVTRYNNYVTLIGLLNSTFNTVFGKANSVIGNYIVVNGGENSYTLFKRIFFANFVVTSYISIGIFVVCNEVISVWVGKEYTWSFLILVVLVYNNYSRYILQTCEAFRGAAGLYSPRAFVKYLALLEGALNLLASMALIALMENNVLAILFGTSISTVMSTIAVPWIVYKFLFKRPLREFFIIYCRYIGIAIVALILSERLFAILCTGSHIINVVIGIIVCTMITGIVYLLVFFHTDELKYNMEIVKNYIHGKLH